MYKIVVLCFVNFLIDRKEHYSDLDKIIMSIMNKKYFFFFFKQNRSHYVAIVGLQMAPFDSKSTSKLRSALHVRNSRYPKI